jgi:hypothetical protein
VEEEAEIQAKVIGNLFNEDIIENFPILCNDINTHIQEAFQTPNRHDQKRTILHHVIIKILELENKEMMLKVAGEKR